MVKGVGLHLSTPVKTCKQNIVGNINDIINIRPIVNREDKYSESVGKSAEADLGLLQHPRWSAL